MTERPLTVNEAADFLGVSPWRVRDYITLGLLQANRLGNGTSKRGSRRRYRIWKHNLINFVNKGIPNMPPRKAPRIDTSEVRFIKDAAEFLSVSQWQIRQYVRKGLLPRNYIRKRLVFYEKDLVKFLEGSKTSNMPSEVKE